jgi:hypothetical protein
VQGWIWHGHRPRQKAQNVMDLFPIILDVTATSFSIHLQIRGR